MTDICFLKFGFYNVTKLKKTNLSHLLTLILKISQTKHGFLFILVTLKTARIHHFSTQTKGDINTNSVYQQM
jgi:hypothetical protein